MAGIIACMLDSPDLAAAVAARGMRLVPMAEPAGIAAAVLAWSPAEGDAARCLADLRARGWFAPLLLVVPDGTSVTAALDAGADDAVPSSADAAEIAARLAARLRARPAPITAGDLLIDPADRRVARGGRPIALLPREYALLLHLVRAQGRCVSRAELLAQVCSLRFDPGTNVIEVHVSRLRAKLDRGFARPLLVTEKGRGYRIATD